MCLTRVCNPVKTCVFPSFLIHAHGLDFGRVPKPCCSLYPSEFLFLHTRLEYTACAQPVLAICVFLPLTHGSVHRRVANPCAPLTFQPSSIVSFYFQFVFFCFLSLKLCPILLQITMIDSKHKICWLKNHSPPVITWMLRVRPITT